MKDEYTDAQLDAMDYWDDTIISWNSDSRSPTLCNHW